jgi:hypothetical protein
MGVNLELIMIYRLPMDLLVVLSRQDGTSYIIQ